MNIRKYISIFLLMMSMMLLDGCINDYTFIDDGQTKPDSESMDYTKYSLRIKIKNVDSNSRTDTNGSLVDGWEYKIGSKGNFALFFTDDDKFYDCTLLAFDKDNAGEDDNIEWVYETKLDPKMFEEFPLSCLVVLNSPSLFEYFSEFDDSRTLDEVLGTLLSSTIPFNLGTTEEGYFLMTNSRYYEDGKLQGPVKVTEDMIYDPKDPLSKANAPVLTVYVERILAKFSLEFNEKSRGDSGDFEYENPKAQELVVFNGFDEKGAPQYKSVKWSVGITGWYVNGLESDAYLFKQLNRTNYFSEWMWNDPANYRTFWAEDAHYAGDYALQYRESKDVLGVNSYKKFEEQKKNQLTNYSFNYLGLDSHVFDNIIYTPENTYDYDMVASKLDGRPDLLAGTHILIGARLKVDKGAGQFLPQEYYRDRDGFYYESDFECFKACLYAINSALSSQDSMRYIYYDWDGTHPELHGQEFFANTKGEYKYYINGEPLTNDSIDSYDPDFLALATIKSGDGRRLPWKKNSSLDILLNDKRFTVTDKTRKKTHTVTENDIKSLLFEWLGALDHFKDGRMYYASPSVIMHGVKRNFCGVVRNNWYQFNLLDIKGLGTPVDDPDQIIIPDPIYNNDQLNLTVKILPWHYVSTEVPIM